jgi:hypothetical protein
MHAICALRFWKSEPQEGESLSLTEEKFEREGLE